MNPPYRTFYRLHLTKHWPEVELVKYYKSWLETRNAYLKIMNNKTLREQYE